MLDLQKHFLGDHCFRGPWDRAIAEKCIIYLIGERKQKLSALVLA